MDVGGGAVDTLGQAQRVIDTSVHLYSEVLFVALSDWCISGGPTVLSGHACHNYFLWSWAQRDGAASNNAAVTPHQIVFLQVLAHFFEQHLAKAMLLQKVTGLESCDLVR